MKRSVLIGILLLAAGCLNAQNIDTAYFRLQYTPELIPNKKINQPPTLKDTVTEKVTFNYYIIPQRFDATFKPTPIKYNKVSPDGPDKMYRNFLKVGFGYPLTPLLDFSFHNLQDNRNSFGANLHHFSYWAPQIGKTMKQYAYAPTSDTRLHLNYKHFFKHQTFYSSIDYNHEASRFYGFKKDTGEMRTPPPPKDSLKNNFHHLMATAGIASNYVLEEKKLKQDVGLNYDLIRTNWKDMENHVGLNSFFAYDARWAKISGSQLYRLNLNLDYFNENRPEQTTIHELLFNPEAYAHFTIKEYHILVGIGCVVDADNMNTEERFKSSKASTIYPIAEIRLGVVPSILSIYAGVNGGAHFNSMKELLYENPFVKPHLNILRTTTDRISIYGGVKGNLVKKLNYDLSARYSYSNNMAFFIIDTTHLPLNQFDVEYHKGNRLNVSLTMDYEILRNLHIDFSAGYRLYALSDTMPDGEKAVALHKPMLEFAFNGQYILKEKFVFDLNFNLDFGRKALFYEKTAPSEYVYHIGKMRPILDFGIGFKYLINDHFAAFCSINNLACQHYAKYYDFKNMGINILGGITYSFGHESIKSEKKKK